MRNFNRDKECETMPFDLGTRWREGDYEGDACVLIDGHWIPIGDATMTDYVPKKGDRVLLEATMTRAVDDQTPQEGLMSLVSNCTIHRTRAWVHAPPEIIHPHPGKPVADLIAERDALLKEVESSWCLIEAAEHGLLRFSLPALIEYKELRAARDSKESEERGDDATCRPAPLLSRAEMEWAERRRLREEVELLWEQDDHSRASGGSCLFDGTHATDGVLSDLGKRAERANDLRTAREKAAEPKPKDVWVRAEPTADGLVRIRRPEGYGAPFEFTPHPDDIRPADD